LQELNYLKFFYFIPNEQSKLFEIDEQANRTSPNITKSESAVGNKPLQKEEEDRQRPVDESIFNLIKDTICLGSETNQQEFSSNKKRLEELG
jgi:hypothetical protein